MAKNVKTDQVIKTRRQRTMQAPHDGKPASNGADLGIQPSTDRADWSLYRSFLSVVRTGSLSAASRALQITQPTVGRHIATLEESLGGKPLFTRSQSGLLPTDVARELLPHAEAMASAAEALLRAASAPPNEIAGIIRVTASEAVGAEVLPAILTEFRNQFPRVAVELELTNQTVNLLRRDADIAVRMAQPEQQALFARKVGVLHAQLYGTRDYLARYGVPRDFDELRRHAVIGFDVALPPQRIMKSLPLKITRDFFALRCDSDLGQLAALRAGFGIGACQVGIAARDPQLVPVLSGTFGYQMELWVVMHESLKKVARMRAMFDYLVERLELYVKGSAMGV